MTATVQDYALPPRTSGTEKNPPDSERVKDAFARVGYALEESIADLIDNSIDAHATEVLVRFIHDDSRVQRIVVADNGQGMVDAKLREAMRFGSTIQHRDEDLGKYGIGLKSASLSQCNAFSVVTRKGSETSGRRWNSESFGKEWLCETLERDDCSILFGAAWADLDFRKSGTLVIWDELTCMKTGQGKPAGELVQESMNILSLHLGLVFHRFLQRRLVRIRIDSQLSTRPATGIIREVEPLDPFGYAQSGAVEYPKTFTITLAGIGDLNLKAHIWPKRSKEPGYKLGGGRVSARQGFYFYRNDRIIQAGGWNGLRGDDTEPHLSLARVAIDLPPTISGFDVSIQKNKVNVPQMFIDAVHRSSCGPVRFPDYLEEANGAYRARGMEDPDFPLVPWQGIGESARDQARQVLARNERSVRKVGFEWANLDHGVVFDIDVNARRIKLNEFYRKALLNGARRSKTDGQVLKMLLFFLVSQCFDKKIISRKQREELEGYNQILLRCLK